jgi:hypothetical protein
VTKSSDYGQTDRVYHYIDTGEAHLFRQLLRKLLLAKQADMGKIPKHMPRHGIIEESNSPCSSLVLVQKKNLDLCFCVDYRKLNGITKKTFPLPRIGDTLDMFAGARWFSPWI